MMARSEVEVVVRLADCAQDFVEAALDLLVAVEGGGLDENPIDSYDTWEIRAKAAALRKIADGGDW